VTSGSRVDNLEGNKYIRMRTHNDAHAVLTFTLNFYTGEV